ncbi:hypothetical protein O181_076442 [Austropuccinia psidii MF-1]|uniref:Reverse transcriptase Ty1/copia-type domain-containing protein n=1 Tax=Austropuccinia psidii MF-1 TaxID=1389203 RepID=A0A9Q3IDT2_9BASI|nr:hypothetical protein [Austropuccinia psidii MF-1]
MVFPKINSNNQPLQKDRSFLNYNCNVNKKEQYDELTPTIEEIARAEDARSPDMVDEVHTGSNERIPEGSGTNTIIHVIGPQHPTLITSSIDQIDVLPYSRRGNTLLTTLSEIPSTYKITLKSKNKDQWLEAISKELHNMNRLKIWEIIDLKEDYKLIGTTSIFQLKTNHSNEIKEYKARLCAQGFSQIQGSDYEKTFAPTG